MADKINDFTVDDNILAQQSSSGSSWVTTSEAQLQPNSKLGIIADGQQVIIKNNSNTEGNVYHCFKGFSVNDFGFQTSLGNYPQINISGSCNSFVSKEIDIPDHIPEEQHARYILGVFNAKE